MSACVEGKISKLNHRLFEGTMAASSGGIFRHRCCWFSNLVTIYYFMLVAVSNIEAQLIGKFFIIAISCHVMMLIFPFDFCQLELSEIFV